MPIEVFLPGTWQLTQDEVLIAMWPSYAAIAPEPSVADSRSGSAVTTGTPAGMPVAAAAESSTVPTTAVMPLRVSRYLETGRFACLWRDAPEAPLQLSLTELHLFLEGCALVGTRPLSPPPLAPSALRTPRSFPS